MSCVVLDDQAGLVSSFVAKKLGIEGWSQCRSVGLERDGRIIAGVVYDYYTGVNICMHIAAIDGESWMTKEFLKMIFHYPFVQLGVNRLTGIIPESNKKSVNFAQKLKGAYLEARLKGAHPDGDMLIFVMFKKDCDYLKLNGIGGSFRDAGGL